MNTFRSHETPRMRPGRFEGMWPSKTPGHVPSLFSRLLLHSQTGLSMHIIFAGRMASSILATGGIQHFSGYSGLL